MAKDILNTLDINPASYTNDNPIKEWIAKAEAQGIFIFRTSFIHSRLKLDSDELQGFAIADPYAPFVFSAKDVFTTAKKLGISSFAFLVRALGLNLITIDKYRTLKQAADAEYKAFLKREEEKKAKQKMQEKRAARTIIYCSLIRTAGYYSPKFCPGYWEVPGKPISCCSSRWKEEPPGLSSNKYLFLHFVTLHGKIC